MAQADFTNVKFTVTLADDSKVTTTLKMFYVDPEGMFTQVNTLLDNFMVQGITVGNTRYAPAFIRTVDWKEDVSA